MITEALNEEKIDEMKRLYAAYRSGLRPNRKTGAEVDAYFRSRYSHQPFDDGAFQTAVTANIMENAPSRAKLRDGMRPDIRCYWTDGVLVGIDLVTGEFHVESRDMAKAVPVYDDLFAFRGLAGEDLKNFVLVAEYVKSTQKEFVAICYTESAFWTQ